MTKKEVIEIIKKILVDEGLNTGDVPEWLKNDAKALFRGLKKAKLLKTLD